MLTFFNRLSSILSLGTAQSIWRTLRRCASSIGRFIATQNDSSTGSVGMETWKGEQKLIVVFLQGYSITGCRRGFVGNFLDVALGSKAAYCSTFKELRGKGKSRVGGYLRHTACV